MGEQGNFVTRPAVGPIEEESASMSMDEFEAVFWRANEGMEDAHPALVAGFVAIYEQLWRSETGVSRVGFTDVTLRDGQQQQTNEVTVEERVEVFDTIISTGVDRIEIGHLGNANGDQQLARALVRHIADKEKTDSLYKDVKIQVLFGSQEKEVQEGSQILLDAFQQAYPETWEREIAERVVVHVYDRVDPNLMNTASEPYDIRQSAYRVSVAAAYAQVAGFKNFSISGEATTAIEPEGAIQYYRSITERLFAGGAETVNVNLPNTYGYSATAEWNTATVAAFNAAVKYGFEEKVTTSIHAHNDVDNAISYTMSALVAGIDRVEGTLIGVGERTGNAATIDVVARLLEQARHQKLRQERAAEQQRVSWLAQHASQVIMKRIVTISPAIAENLHNWYPAGEKLAKIFGPHADYRWRRTAVGNRYAHHNGSGPHDQVMAAAIIDPVNHPGDISYEWALLTHSALGRPGMEDIAVGDPVAVDEVTIGNYAGGGKTRAIKEGGLQRASDEEVARARVEFRARRQALLDALLSGVKLVSG
jgi:isopropylmalate/homocitrate/citramalate synthase